jgi:hypothetical protein
MGDMKHEKLFSPSSCEAFPSFGWPYALLVLLFLVLAMFGGVILSDANRILSSPQADIASQFIYWRDFGFSELKRGNLALWNPHLFSGAPFFGGFQSALLYPLNFPYLFLPLGIAVNAGIMLHVFLLGFFMYLWGRQRGIHPLAALLTGILIMFCGPHFFHIYAGHLTNLCAMTWVPLIFLALDGLLKKRSLGWFLLGSFAFAMQILAGHPQYVYYTIIAALVYIFTVVIYKPYPRPSDFLSRPSGRSIIFTSMAILGMFAAGTALSAVQILTGIDAARESVRAGGVPFSFAAMFSLPPENLITLVAPYFFGDLIKIPYWGRAYLWEMNLFISINGLILAAYGLLKGGRPARALAITAILLLIAAFGAHTPIFRILFDYFPGFDKFRGTSKFIFFAALFLIAIAGVGLDALLKMTTASSSCAATEGKRQRIKIGFFLKRAYLLIYLLALLATGGAVYLHSLTDRASSGAWSHLIHQIAATGETYLDQSLLLNKSFIHQTASFSSTQLIIAALIMAISGTLWLLTRNNRKIAAYGIFFLTVAEIFIFALTTVASFDIRDSRIPVMDQFVSSVKNDARILNLVKPNSALATGALDLWGYDPGVPRRYAELIAFTQGQDPQKASQYVHFHRHHPLLKMLRLQYVITPGEGALQIQELPEPLARLQLIPQWRLVPEKEQILTEMASSDFDPLKTVVLEKTPDWGENLCPDTGTANILSSSTDDFTIEARLACNSVLLITDNYSDGWHVEDIRTNGRISYEIMRANHTLMAIPLERGNHVFRVFYRPLAFTVGTAISAIAVLLYGIISLYWWKRRKGNRANRP